MSIETPIVPAGSRALAAGYLESLALVERLHRLLLDVIKDEFERLGMLEVNSVQALLLFNIGEHEVTAGELKSRGYYQGSNVSYNRKKLVDMGFMHHQRCDIDRRSVRVRLTPKGREVRNAVAELFERHAGQLEAQGFLMADGVGQINHSLKRLERFWTDQIRYIYCLALSGLEPFGYDQVIAFFLQRGQHLIGQDPLRDRASEMQNHHTFGIDKEGFGHRNHAPIAPISRFFIATDAVIGIAQFR